MQWSDHRQLARWAYQRCYTAFAERFGEPFAYLVGQRYLAGLRSTMRAVHVYNDEGK